MSSRNPMRARLLPLIAVLGALVACASPEAKRTASVRSVEELPPEYRELWLAWVRADPDWSARRERALADPALTSFLVDNLMRTMLASYRAGTLRTRPDQPLGSFERSQNELAALGASAAPALSELLPLGSGAASSLAHDLLVRIGRPSIDPALSLLEREDSPEARRRAANLLGELPNALEREPAVRARLIAHLGQDPDWLVRKSCALAVASRATRDVEIATARSALSRALSDPDPGVARAAAEGLVQLEDPAAIPALIDYLARSQRAGDLRGELTAQASLRALSGELGTRDVRAWRQWWSQHPR